MPAIKKRPLFLIAILVLLLWVWLSPPSSVPLSDHGGAAHSKAELKWLVNSPRFRARSVTNYLVQDDVPVLIEMLNDRRNWKDWGQLAWALGFLDEGTEAQHAIIHLIQRGDVWPWRERTRRKLVWLKISAVGLLDRTNGEIAHATARDALTKSGALKLTQEWIGRDLPGQFKSNPERVVALIRGHAALGLVWAQDEEGIEQVEKLFESVAPEATKQRQRQLENSIAFFDLTLEEQALHELYTGLVDALATRDLIDDIGYDQFQKLSESDDHEVYMNAVFGYLDKYLEGYPFRLNAK